MKRSKIKISPKTERTKEEYYTEGYGSEEDKDIILKGKKCTCGRGELQYQRRHEACGTREVYCMGGSGRSLKVVYRRVETVVCPVCKQLYDVGIYKAWLLEEFQRHPYRATQDQIDLFGRQRDKTTIDNPPRHFPGRRRTDGNTRYRARV